MRLPDINSIQIYLLPEYSVCQTCHTRNLAHCSSFTAEDWSQWLCTTELAHFEAVIYKFLAGILLHTYAV
jgi:hypothetical protein